MPLQSGTRGPFIIREAASGSTAGGDRIMPKIDLLFPVIGSRLPTDHGYPLYSALSRILPRLHEGTLPFGLLPISGQYAGNGLLSLNVRESRLRLRVDTNDIPALLPLAG